MGLAALQDDEQLELIRRDLLNLTTSYADEADIFTELIQNAIDAISLQLSDKANGSGGELLVVIGRRRQNAHYIYVQDNGCGMSEEIVDKVFLPGFSLGKKRGRTIGYKGVGMSYVLGVSNHIAVKTVLPSGDVAERTILHTSDWVLDDANPVPTVKQTFVVPRELQEIADNIERGTGVYFEFHPNANPGSLEGLVIIGDGPQLELKNWASFLCAKSALGIALPGGVEPKVEVNVTLGLDDGDSLIQEKFARGKFNPKENCLGYPFPSDVFKVGSNTSDIDATPEAQRVIQHGRRHQAVYHEWKVEELVDEMHNLDGDERTLLLSHLDWIYGWFCYSTDVLEQVRKLMGTRSQLVRWGAKLVVDGAPQGRPLGLTLTSDSGLDRQTHIVLGFGEVDLDTGRKYVSDERLTAAINKLTARVVTKLKEYRWALKIKEREPVASDLKEWITRVDARAGDSLIAQLFESRDNVPPARVNPDEEQEVIALWTALVAVGFLNGYEMRALSGFKRYDGVVNITEQAVSGGGQLAPLTPTVTPKDNAVIEFKILFSSLVEDFESGKKLPNEIDLVVCWDCPELNLPSGVLRPTYGEWSHERPVRAASYIYKDGSGANVIPVIALKNVVAELLCLEGIEAGVAMLKMIENRDKEKMV